MFALAWGIRRRLVGFLLLAAAIGGCSVFAIHAATAHGYGFAAHAAVIACAILSVWAVSWMATFVVARPLRHLAKVAEEIHEGRLQSRERLPDGNDEVGRVGGALHAVTERVAKQLADQRALLAAVSHELRSPLGRARVLVEMAREGTAPASVHDDLQAEIDAMDNLVGDLLAAARIDFEAVNPVDLAAHDVAKRAIEIAHLPPETLVVPTSSGGASPAGTSDVRVKADPTLLARALSGLLDNARRYGATSIRLAVVTDEDTVRFVVEDDGPGFAAGDEERAFEPFWRGPAADGRAVPRGEGLGLALVRQIAQAHGGTAAAEARTPDGGDRRGARVWIELPKAGGV